MTKVTKDAKQKLWKEKLKELDKIVDNEGTPIDENIKETVVAFNLNGFPTIKSCGGHTWNDHLSFPFVLGRAFGMPENRFTGDKKIRERIALTHHTIPEEIEINPSAADEYDQLIEKLGLHETREYQEWDGRNEVLRRSLELLLKEFYQNRKVARDAKLYSAQPMLGFLITAGRRETKDKIKEHKIKTKEIAEFQKTIIAAQGEMNAFAEFLKDKFFKSGK